MVSTELSVRTESPPEAEPGAAVEGPSATTRATVIITSRDEGDALKRTVHCLLATLPPDARIVVVDDASSDGSSAFLDARYPCVDVVRSDVRLGCQPARNLGASMATGDLLVFADAHVEPEPGWLDGLERALDRPGVAAAGPVLLDEAGRSPRAGLSWSDATLNVRWLPLQGKESYSVPMLGAGFLAIRRETFAMAGGWDEGLLLMGGGDNELCLRLWTMGLDCVVVPTVQVRHRFRAGRPYPVDDETRLHNLLRVAFIHFAEPRLAATIGALRDRASFPRALARVFAGDALHRRRELMASRVRTDGEFFERFPAPGLS